MVKLGEIQRRPASEQVEEAIKRYILENNLKPGDTLPTETEMAEMLGTSRTTVREALRVLQFLGVIKTKQRIGPICRPMLTFWKIALCPACSLGNKKSL